MPLLNANDSHYTESMTSTDALPHLDTLVAARLGLVFAHLLAFASAAAAIAFGDFALFARRRIDAALLARAARVVAWSLAALWATGLALTWIDTGFAPAALASRPKLLAKLSVVTLLTLNGVALHRFAFPRLTGRRIADRAELRAIVLLGGMSAATWLFAAFLGVARPLAGVLGYGGFMVMYGLVLGVGCAAALRVVRPRLARRLFAGDATRAPSAPADNVLDLDAHRRPSPALPSGARHSTFADA